MIEHGKKLQVSRHNYQVELTVINVTKADEENVHSLKITKRLLVNDEYASLKTFKG